MFLLTINFLALIAIAIVFGLWVLEQNTFVKNLSAEPKVIDLAMSLQAKSIVDLVDEYMIEGDGLFNGFSLDYRRLKFEVDIRVTEHKALLAEKQEQLNIKMQEWYSRHAVDANRLVY